MEKLFDFIGNGQTFFIATVEGGQPRVRPFGFAMEFENKIYFMTSTEKKVYKQLVANPRFEICALNDKAEWVRLTGEAIMDNNNLAAKEHVFQVMPDLAQIYTNAANPVVAVFYVKNPAAKIYSMTAPAVELAL